MEAPDTPGDSPGDTPGDSAGDTPGDTPGDSPGDTSGDTPGDTPGDTSGDTPGDSAVPAAPVTPREGGGGTEEQPAPELLDATQGHPEGLQAPALLRQVAALCACPALLENEGIPGSAKELAREILTELQGGSPGSYNLEYVQGRVAARAARFLSWRDAGVPCQPQNVVPTAGTAAAIVDVLSLLRLPAPALPLGVLVPVPGPPLCAAAAGLAGAVPVPYPLDPARGWAPDPAQLRRAAREARSRCRPKVLWVVNPGDPTGHVLSRELMQRLLLLAAEEPLLLLADEVHQELAFCPQRPFLSFRRVLAELGPPLATGVQLLSCYSLGKGIAPGGARAGFLALENVERSVLRQFYTWGLSVYPPILGQLMLDLAMEPPGEGGAAAQAMEEHRRSLLGALAANARRLQRGLGRAPGIRCPAPAGGPRALPRVRIPARARRQARALGLEPDVFFCRKLQEATGLLVTPGSHFGLGGDSGHLGLSLLLPPPLLERALLLLRRFQARFLREFS